MKLLTGDTFTLHKRRKKFFSPLRFKPDCKNAKIRRANQQLFSEQSHPPPHNSTTSLTVSALRSRSKLASSAQDARFDLSPSEIAVSCLPVRDPSLSTEGANTKQTDSFRDLTKQNNSTAPGLHNQQEQSSVRNSVTTEPQPPAPCTLI